MNCEIICVGTELLLGNIVNTNAQYLAERLSSVGVDVFYQTVVGDNSKRLISAMEIAANRADVLIFTGGLGPTSDDITKEVVSSFFGEELVLDEKAKSEIEAYFKKVNRKITSNNLKQAYVPKNCIVLYNKRGTAPGIIIEKDDKIAVLLPGPPHEMAPMFEEYVVPFFKEKTGEIIKSKTLKLFGIGESKAAAAISDIIDNQNNPTVAPYAKTGEAELRITAKASSEKEADLLIEKMEKDISSRLGRYIYGYNNDSLESVFVAKLMEKGLLASVAESCTGGLLGFSITSVPGASEVFEAGAITYSNSIKNSVLGVKNSTLDNFGAVSYQTASEMARGVKNAYGADIGISVTGIAGPGGGTEEKPVGLVYVGAATEKGTVVRKLSLSGSRDTVRKLSVKHALKLGIYMADRL